MNDLEKLWALKRARGLSANEKSLIAIVIAYGATCYASADLLAADAGLSRTVFYAVRRSLTAKGILVAKRRNHTSTLYTIDGDVLASQMSESDTLLSAEHAATEGAKCRIPDSQMSESDTISITTEENQKKDDNSSSVLKVVSAATEPAAKSDEPKSAPTGKSADDAIIAAVIAIAAGSGFECTTAEAKTLVAIYRKAVDVDSEALVRDALVYYFDRRAVGAVASPFYLRSMLRNPLFNQPRASTGGMPAGPTNVREQDHASGGRRYTDVLSK